MCPADRGHSRPPRAERLPIPVRLRRDRLRFQSCLLQNGIVRHKPLGLHPRFFQNLRGRFSRFLLHLPRFALGGFADAAPFGLDRFLEFGDFRFAALELAQGGLACVSTI